MIKVALAVLAVAVIGVGIFMFTQSQENVAQRSETPTQPQASMVDNTNAAPKAESKPATVAKVQETPKVKQDQKVEVAKTEESIPQPTGSSEVSSGEDIDHIGEGLTLEGIEAMDVSEEEKERLRNDLAFYKNRHTEPSKPLSGEEILKVIEEDLKNGLIQNKN